MSLEQTNVIDAFGIEEATGRLILVMRHEAEWDGSDAQLFHLQEKLNAYLSFALDGEMASAYPELAGHRLAVRIDCATPPDPRALHMLGHARSQLQFQDIGVEVRLLQGDDRALPESGSHHCGGGCKCH